MNRAVSLCNFLKNNPLDSIIAICIVFWTSSAIYFISAHLGITYAQIGGGGVIIFGIYCIVNIPFLLSIKRRSLLFWLLFLTGIYPAFTILYSSYVFPREIVLQVLYIEIMLSTLILVYRYSPCIMGRLSFWILCVTLLGGYLSLFSPEYFSVMKEVDMQKKGQALYYENIFIVDGARMYGFQLQSNMFAATAILFNIIFIFLRRGNSFDFFIKVIMTIATGGTVILSGSRGGLLIYLLAFLLIFFYYIRTGERLTNGVIVKFSNFALYSIFIIIPLFPILSILIQHQSGLNTTKQINSVERFNIFASKTLATEDSSIVGRVGLFNKYLGFTISKPFGRGWKMVNDYVSKSGDWGPHNQYLLFTYEYGVQYLFIWLIFLYYILMVKNFPDPQIDFSLFAITMIILAYSFTSHVVFDQYSAYVFYGIIVGTRLFQDKIPIWRN